MGEMNIQTEESQQQSDARSPGAMARARLRIFGFCTAFALRILGATWRVEVVGDDPRKGRDSATSPTAGSGQLAALFHESMLPCAWFFRDLRYSVAVSRSRDGDLIRATLQSLGYSEPVRGSSSRGGAAALRGLVRQLTGGTTISVLVDGPRGPARVAKTGIVALADRTGTPIQPVAFSARPSIRLKSWDRSLVPLPFARVVCAFGKEIAVATAGDDEREQELARRLDEELAELHRAADRAVEAR